MKGPKNKVLDQRSKKFIFIPFCLICQSFQAQGIVKYGHKAVIKPVIEEILKHDVNIVQMPCSEAQLGGYEDGLKRCPQGIDKYDTPEFKEICERCASEMVKLIKAILANEYEITAILGLEFSPSCATSLQYSAKGTFHRQGLFIEALSRKLKQEKIEIPFVGINRRGINKSVERVKQLFYKQERII